MLLITDKDSELIEWNYGGQELDYLLQLLETSTYEERSRERIRMMVEDPSLSREEYDRISGDLYQNQLDPITSGLPYNMGDIRRHLKKLR